MNSPTLLRTLTSSALIAWAASQTASAIVILDFVEVEGGNHATGELRLNTLDDQEQPLAGSFLDVDGPGPISPFDITITPFRWRVLGDRTAVLGIDTPNQFELLVNGVGIPGDDFGEQYYLDRKSKTQGNGNWVPRPVTGVPDAGSTMPLFAGSLAALVAVGGRWRIVAP